MAAASPAKGDRAEHLFENVPGQARRYGRECRCHRRRVARAEGAALEQAARNGLGHQRERDGGGQRKPECDLEGARLRGRDGRFVATPAAMRGTSTAAIAIEATPSGSS